MGSVVISGATSGAVTLAVPAEAGTRTLTLPAETGTAVVKNGDGDVTLAGTLSYNGGYGSAVPAYGCRAWIKFNGTGTIAINASAGVTGITDIGVGTYSVTLSFTMPDINYSKVVSMAQNAGFAAQSSYVDYSRQANAYLAATTTVFVCSNMRVSDALAVDTEHINAAVFR